MMIKSLLSILNFKHRVCLKNLDSTANFYPLLIKHADISPSPIISSLPLIINQYFSSIYL